MNINIEVDTNKVFHVIDIDGQAVLVTAVLVDQEGIKCKDGHMDLDLFTDLSTRWVKGLAKKGLESEAVQRIVQKPIDLSLLTPPNEEIPSDEETPSTELTPEIWNEYMGWDTFKDGRKIIFDGNDDPYPYPKEQLGCDIAEELEAGDLLDPDPLSLANLKKIASETPPPRWFDWCGVRYNPPSYKQRDRNAFSAVMSVEDMEVGELELPTNPVPAPIKALPNSSLPSKRVIPSPSEETKFVPPITRKPSEGAPILRRERRYGGVQ